MRIEIDIPRPIQTLGLLVIVTGVFIWLSGGSSGESTQASLIDAGGSSEVPQENVKQAEQDIQRVRAQQAILERKEEILRYQLDILEKERKGMRAQASRELMEEFRESNARLVQLLQDKREAELYLLESLRQLWDAQVRGSYAGSQPGVLVDLQWPIEPHYGLSAHFLDHEYEELFGIPHQAVDIPALQGTDIAAAASGKIEKVVDNGLGYNYIIIRHGGMATLYGHVSEFFVEEGDQVNAGDVIGLSGGRPGSPGAGALSTGPHLHFEVIVEGERVDPLEYLPKHSAV